MVLEDIISTYFVYPLVNRTGDYNIINTVTYAILLFVGTYLVYTKLLKNRVNMDAKFALSFSSFAVFAASIHVLDDMKIIVSNLLVTPMIQFIMYILFLILLPFSLFAQKHWKIEYWKIDYCPKKMKIITKVENNGDNNFPFIWNHKSD